MESIGSSVTNIDRHLDVIEYSLGRMQRHSTRPITPFNKIAQHNIPVEQARYGGHSQPSTRQSSSRDLDIHIPSTRVATTVGANMGRSQPQTSTSVSKDKPLNLRSWRGGSSSNISIAPSSAKSAQPPLNPSRKPRKGEKGDGMTLDDAHRFKKPIKQRKSVPLSRSFTSLLSSSSSTLLPSSSSSSRSSSCFSRSPSTSDQTCPVLLSTVSTALTSASLASFSSLENSTAGELATRCLQWRKAAYHLLASHYEKCHGTLLATRKGGRRGVCTKTALDTSNEEEHYQSEVEQQNDSRENLTTPTESIASLDTLSESEDFFEVYDKNNNTESTQQYHSTPSNVSSQRNNTAAEQHEQYTQQPGTRSGLGRKAIVATEREAAARNREIRQRLVEREEAERDALEQDEDEGFTDLLEQMGREAIVAADREAAARRQEIRQRLVEREEGERDALEQDEDEGFTDLLEQMGREAIVATEREAAARRQEIRQRLVEREEAERDALEQDEGEGFTDLLEQMGREAIVATEREAAARNREIRQRLVEREEAERDALEQDEDEGFTDLLEQMGREAIVAAEREAARVAAEFDTLLKAEAAERHAIDAEALQAANAIERELKRSSRSATNRERRRLAAEATELATSRTRAECELKPISASESFRQQSPVEQHQRQYVQKPVTRPELGRDDITAVDTVYHSDDKFNTVANVWMKSDRAAQTLEYKSVVRSTQTEVDEYNSSSNVVSMGIITTPTDTPYNNADRWKQLYLHSESIQAGFPMSSAAVVAVQTDIKEQEVGNKFFREGENKNAVPRTDVPVRCSRTSQTPIKLHNSVQTSDEISQNVKCKGTDAVPTDSSLTSENNANAPSSLVPALKLNMEENNKSNLLTASEHCIFPENDNSELHQVEEEYHNPSSTVYSHSSALRQQSSHSTNVGSTTGMKVRKEESSTTTLDGLEQSANEQDSSRSVMPIEQTAPCLSHASSKATISKDSSGTPGENYCLHDTGPVFKDTKSLNKGRSGKRRDGARKNSSSSGSSSNGAGADGIPLAAVSTAPGAFFDETHWHMRDSLSFDEDRPVTFSQCGFDTFDMDFCGNDSLQAVVFREILRVEARHRRHVERHEVMERNELRWDELTHFRVLVRNFTSLATPTAAAVDDNDDIPAAVPGDDEYVAAHLDSMEPNTAGMTDDALGWIGGSVSAVDDKENITPRTEVPRPFATVGRKSSTAWCVDMTSGPSGIPPHLRDRPWAPMLTRRSSGVGDDNNHNKYDNGGSRKTSQSIGIITATTTTTTMMKKKKGMKGKLASFSSSRGTLPESDGDLVLELYERHPHDVTLYQTPECVPVKRNVRSTPGYAQQYKRRLMQQQQSGDGVSTKDPLYCRATTCFLESAEWRYQKMYVDQQLYRSPFEEKRSGGARKCTDAICEEVGRAHSTWENTRR